MGTFYLSVYFEITILQQDRCWFFLSIFHSVFVFYIFTCHNFVMSIMRIINNFVTQTGNFWIEMHP